MTAIANEVTRLSVRIRHFAAYILLFIRSTRQADSEIGVYALDETGAVCAVCKGSAAPDIWIADTLSGIVYNRRHTARATGASG